MRLNLHLVRIFFTVIEHNSFSRAADALFVSQSAISKGVRELENQLGLPLIERGSVRADRSRMMALTEGGQALYEHARAIFALEAAAVDELDALTGLRRGRMTIGASTTVASYWLPPYVALFSRQYPDIEIRIVVANTTDISQGLLDYNMDIAVVEGGVEQPGILTRHWRDESLVIVAASDSPLVSQTQLALSDLRDERWLVRETGSGTREVTQRLLQNDGMEPSDTLEIGSNEGIARAVAHGLGIALLPYVVVQDLLELGRLKKLCIHGVFNRPLFRLAREGRQLLPAGQAFWDLLIGHSLTGQSRTLGK